MDILPGDMLHRRKGLVTHCGTALGWQSGQFLVAHSLPGRGYHVSSLDDFAAGHEVYVAHRPQEWERFEVLARVEEQLGLPYSLLTRNCQHGCSYAATGRAQSWGVALAALGVVGALLLVVLVSGR